MNKHDRQFLNMTLDFETTSIPVYLHYVSTGWID